MFEQVGVGEDVERRVAELAEQRAAVGASDERRQARAGERLDAAGGGADGAVASQRRAPRAVRPGPRPVRTS